MSLDAAMRTALTVAGSDSGGGAGIQADLRSFAAVGVHGASVVTCVTAQNTVGVDSIFPIPVREVTRQLDAVLSDLRVHAAKTGMLYSAEITRAVARRLDGTTFPLVVDPVMVATVGASLEAGDLRRALVRHLVPRAELVTPNLDEAAALSGLPVASVEDMRAAAKAIHGHGARAVLVKGGHLRGPLVDVLYDGRRFTELRGFRHARALHGSGCALAASIAGYRARGLPLSKAVASGRARIAAGFLTSYKVGRGVRVIDSHAVPDRYAVWRAVTEAAHEAASVIPAASVPEVGVNLGYALPGATSPDDVCALQGRMILVGGRLRPAGNAAFGASRHVARIILTVLRHDPRKRAAINLKYTEKNLGRAKKAGLAVGTFDRGMQPKGTSTMEWGTETAIVQAGRVPDVIADPGGVGKEGMIRVVGKEPRDVLRKVQSVVRRS